MLHKSYCDENSMPSFGSVRQRIIRKELVFNDFCVSIPHLKALSGLHKPRGSRYHFCFAKVRPTFCTWLEQGCERHRSMWKNNPSYHSLEA